MIAIGERDPKYVILHFVCPLRRCARLALSGYKLCILTRSSTPRYTNVICMSIYSHMTLTYIKATRARTPNIYKRNRCFSFSYLSWDWYLVLYKSKAYQRADLFSEDCLPCLLITLGYTWLLWEWFFFGISHNMAEGNHVTVICARPIYEK